MKRYLKVFSAAIMAGMFLTACGGNDSKEEGKAEAPEVYCTVDTELAAAGDLAGYIELVSGQYEKKCKDTDETNNRHYWMNPEFTFKVVNPVEVNPYAQVTVAILDDNKNIIETLDGMLEDNAILSMKRQGAQFNVKFEKHMGLDEEEFEKMKSGKYIAIVNSRATVKETEKPKTESSVSDINMTGTVAGKNVDFEATIDNNGKISGRYRYGKNDWIELRGLYEENDRSMLLKEEYNGEVTGTWNLHLNDANGVKTLEGTITNTRNKSYEVHLHDADTDFDSNDSISETSSSGSNDIDKALDALERYINKYTAALKKAQNGDMSALSDIESCMSDAEEFIEKLSDSESLMTAAQAKRYNQLLSKMSTAF